MTSGFVTLDLLRLCRVDLGLTTHDAVTFAGHVALQPSLDDGERELEERAAVGLLQLECGLAGVANCRPAL